MNKYIFRNIILGFFFLFFSLTNALCYALPFSIVPKEGTSLPTSILAGQTATAYYTVSNRTGSARLNNFVKYLPPNVTQVTSGGTYSDTCAATFNLARKNQSGDSCTLQLTVSGAVDGNDPDRFHHLFVCFPGGKTCAGTRNPLNVTVIALNSIAVTPSSASINSGNTQAFVATGTYSDSTTAVITTLVNWASSNTSVATIASTGVATGIAAGSTGITATLDSIASNSAALTVSGLASISISPTTATINIGDTQQFVATGHFPDNTDVVLTSSVQWHSSDETKATIAAGGLATGVATGSSNITATLGALTSNTATLTVVPVLQSIDITPAPSASVNAGETQAFTAIGHYNTGPDQDITTSVTWNSSDSSKATISNTSPTKGVASGVAAGTTNITATLGLITSNTSVLTVVPVLTSIDISPSPTDNVNAGETQAFTATGNYTGQANQDITTSVTWTSSDTAKATISNTNPTKGVATGVAAGTTNITATLGLITSNPTVLTVVPVLTAITISPSPTGSVNVGETQAFTATGTYTGQANQDITTSVTWASSDTAKATISNTNPTKGVATGVAAGTTNITATSGLISSSATVLTVAVPITEEVYISSNQFQIYYCRVLQDGTGKFDTCTSFTQGSFPNLSGISIDPAYTHIYMTSQFAGVLDCPIQANGSIAADSCVGPAGGPFFNYQTAYNPNATPVPLLYANSAATFIGCQIDSNGDVGGCFTVGSGNDYPRSVTINPSYTYAYINNRQNYVTVCEIQSNGTVFGNCINSTILTTVHFGIAINPADTFAYITNQDDNTVQYCAIDATTHLLSSCALTGSGFSMPIGITVDPTGTFAYIANQGNNTVSVCTINSLDGSLSGCDTATTVTEPTGVTIGVPTNPVR